MALRWQELGAPRLHVVDLDGARSGEQANAAAVRAIVEAVSSRSSSAAACATSTTIERWLDAGVERVFLGTAAVDRPRLAAEACARFPGRVAAGADARDGRIAVRGWEADGRDAWLTSPRAVAAAGACALSYTEHRTRRYLRGAGHRRRATA